MARSDALNTSGPRKLVSDAYAVLELHALPMIRQWYLIVLGSVVFPIPMFYVFQAIAPDDPAIWQRLVAGTLIFGVAFSTAMLVGQQIVAQRFLGHLKLIITMPVSKSAYVAGTLAFTSVAGVLSTAFLLGFAFVAGVEINPTWTLAPALLLTVLALAGIVLFVMSFAPSLNLIASLVAIVLVIISPVYFTMEAAPLPLQWFGYVSPLRYAADAIAASLGGRVDIGIEMVVLAAYALVAMGLGLWRLPWRER